MVATRLLAPTNSVVPARTFPVAVVAATGAWRFARPFDADEVETPAIDDATGRFESVGDD